MARLRPWAPAVTAALLQVFLVSRLRLLGLCPPLVPAAVFTSDAIRAEDILLCLVNGALVAMAAVGSFHAVQEQLE